MAVPLQATVTASEDAVLPERVRVKTIGSAADSAPEASVALAVTDGVVTPSSSRIVTCPASSAIVRPVGLDNATWKISSGSFTASPAMEIVTCAVVAPAANVAVPDEAT